MSDLEQAIAKHDSALDAAELDIWIGSEPTFTLRTSEQPQWLSQALGGDKEEIALRMTGLLARRHPGSVILRSVGRQYSDEALPRWSFGLYQRRDQQPLWQGPPDPLLNGTKSSDTPDLPGFVGLLETIFKQRGWFCQRIAGQGQQELRLLTSLELEPAQPPEISDPRLARESVHRNKTPESGLADTLADDGFHLFVLRRRDIGADRYSIALELPAIARVEDFLAYLSALGEASCRVKLDHLLLEGYPPPVDHSIAWTTVTPDPAVIEINQAPQPDIAGFYAGNRELFEIADELGLSPYRLQYNGTMSDSGGGGQFTLGGTTARTSPFFEHPHLLPRLVRYVNQHPSLSYWFATNYVGSASQSPRADEGTLDAFHELDIALDQLQRAPEISPEFLYNSLGAFLADASGNTHRSELNIEKLWNEYLPQRGCLGLLEFRAFRMPYSPGRSAAIAILLRSLAAMLAQNDRAPGLHAWKEELHSRFALSYFLRQDLRQVLADLRQTGFGLDRAIEDLLLQTPDRSPWRAEFQGCRIEIEPAVEFWPLVGDVASQESGGSRLVDASTLRLQISLRLEDTGLGELSDWLMSTGGVAIPLAPVQDGDETILLTGLRFRDFAPWRGLHPSIPPTSPLTIQLSHPEHHEALEIALHNWRADGISYDGLPDDPEDARKRREQRLIVRTLPRAALPTLKPAPAMAISDWLFDLRRLA